MESSRFDINKLDNYIIQFMLAVEEQDGEKFRSFNASRYLTNSEYYKNDIWLNAHRICKNLGNRKATNGDILKDIEEALELGSSTEGALADFKNVNKFLKNAYTKRTDAERALLNFYQDNNNVVDYEEIRSLGVGNYDVLALLAFYKDKDHYLPIRSTKFEERFQLLGYNIKLAGKSEWQFYQQDYLDAIMEIRHILIDTLGCTSDDITLLDAHSFVWLLPYYEGLADTRWRNFILDPIYATEVRTTVLRRVGQQQYRKRMMEIWHGQCSVTGCADERMLTASHAMPYRISEGNDTDKINPYNGFLLIPNLDAAFDAGLITFNDDGSLVVSPQLSRNDAAILGIDEQSMKLRKVYPENITYLKYHRDHVFLK